MPIKQTGSLGAPGAFRGRLRRASEWIRTNLKGEKPSGCVDHLLESTALSVMGFVLWPPGTLDCAHATEGCAPDRLAAEVSGTFSLLNAPFEHRSGSACP
jgi:hypothetical protein